MNHNAGSGLVYFTRYQTCLIMRRHSFRRLRLATGRAAVTNGYSCSGPAAALKTQLSPLATGAGASAQALPGPNSRWGTRAVSAGIPNRLGSEVRALASGQYAAGAQPVPHCQ